MSHVLSVIFRLVNLAYVMFLADCNLFPLSLTWSTLGMQLQPSLILITDQVPIFFVKFDFAEICRAHNGTLSQISHRMRSYGYLPILTLSIIGVCCFSYLGVFSTFASR